MLERLEALRKEANDELHAQHQARQIAQHIQEAERQARFVAQRIQEAENAAQRTQEAQLHQITEAIHMANRIALQNAQQIQAAQLAAQRIQEAENAAQSIQEAQLHQMNEAIHMANRIALQNAQQIQAAQLAAQRIQEAENAAQSIQEAQLHQMNEAIHMANRIALQNAQQIQAARRIAQSVLQPLAQRKALDEWVSKYIGKKGEVTQLARNIGSQPKELRAESGKIANEVKTELTSRYEEEEKFVKEQELARDLESGAVDVTLPGRPRQIGGLHPSTQMLRKFYEIWAEMGFQVYRSRDVEDDETNFTLLNIPPHHPARDMWDTFHTTTPGVILRTHTSPGQIRAMREFGGNGTQPIRVILPGMCYRYEQVSVRSEIQFNQVEGLAIGKNIRMTDLKGTVSEFAKRMFSADTRVRYRSSYFPFTEPSMEVDAECLLCHGEGCAMCKYSGWLEIAGCGMVHPTVLRNGGYDPDVWSGFAFGMGPERMINLKYGVKDIRYYWGNDLRFLEQF